ncbi:hypothetical protein BaRGS_00019011 [Batillaria attramentaria]|uniref:Uncharacterized protein n=1 Tax=Batillaria attramentaria TaxID=370345 RepID=A0ABD0KR85_9CAEN
MRLSDGRCVELTQTTARASQAVLSPQHQFPVVHRHSPHAVTRLMPSLASCRHSPHAGVACLGAGLSILVKALSNGTRLFPALRQNRDGNYVGLNEEACCLGLRCMQGGLPWLQWAGHDDKLLP